MNHKERRTAFILAAGLGTRLREMTINHPKALVELNKQPLLKVTLESLIKQGFNHFVINIHHFGEQILEFLSNNPYPEVEIDISDEREKLMDTGGAIIKALPYFSESDAVLIHNVDIVTNLDFQAFYDEFRQSCDAVWLLTQNRDNSRKLVFDKNDNFIGRFNTITKEFDGNCQFDNNFKLLSFSGLHFIKPRFFKDFELKPCYVFELYSQLAEYHNVKSVQIHPDYWFDLGTKEQLEEASSWLLSQR